MVFTYFFFTSLYLIGFLLIQLFFDLLYCKSKLKIVDYFKVFIVNILFVTLLNIFSFIMLNLLFGKFNYKSQSFILLYTLIFYLLFFFIRSFVFSKISNYKPLLAQLQKSTMFAIMIIMIISAVFVLF